MEILSGRGNLEGSDWTVTSTRALAASASKWKQGLSAQ
jgi:hypothetical protein